MNAKPDRPSVQKTSLENEVILSVVFLYFVISAALLLIHHLQPEGTVTETSSPSPSHAAFYAGAAGPEQGAILARIEQAGYREIGGLRQDGGLWHATASKDGQRWQLQIDPRPVIVATPVVALPGH